MRVSHRDLATCERDPRTWLLAARAPKHGRKRGYDEVVRRSIYAFHKENDAGVARRYLLDAIARAPLVDRARIRKAVETLDAYLRWYPAAGFFRAECGVRVLLSIPGLALEMGGEVSRVDVRTDGYAGVLLGTHEATWGSELRMPLLQEALALRYKRDVSEFAVGVQRLDGSGLELRRYSSSARGLALRRFGRVGLRVKGIARSLDRS